KVIEDVAQHRTEYEGRSLAEQHFVRAERIRALIAVPVLGLHSRVNRGILYLDYRSTQNFTQQEIQFAQSLAHLAAVAIRNWRRTQGLYQEAEVREKELQELGKVLKGALAY